MTVLGGFSKYFSGERSRRHADIKPLCVVSLFHLLQRWKIVCVASADTGNELYRSLKEPRPPDNKQAQLTKRGSCHVWLRYLWLETWKWQLFLTVCSVVCVCLRSHEKKCTDRGVAVVAFLKITLGGEKKEKTTSLHHSVSLTQWKQFARGVKGADLCGGSISVQVNIAERLRFPLFPWAYEFIFVTHFLSEWNVFSFAAEHVSRCVCVFFSDGGFK